MTGGKVIEPRISIKDGKEVIENELVYRIKIADMSQMALDMIVPSSLMPESAQVGDVIRVKSFVASTQ